MICLTLPGIWIRVTTGKLRISDCLFLYMRISFLKGNQFVIPQKLTRIVHQCANWDTAAICAIYFGITSRCSILPPTADVGIAPRVWIMLMFLDGHNQQPQDPCSRERVLVMKSKNNPSLFDCSSSCDTSSNQKRNRKSEHAAYQHDC